MSFIQRFMREEQGATAIEYALIAGGISIVIIAAANALGQQLIGTFNNVASVINSASSR
jgi:pilus assembly protein Flp/PilA